MALDFPPEFPFHRRSPATREAVSPLAAAPAVSPAAAVEAMESRAAMVATAGPRFVEPTAVARQPSMAWPTAQPQLKPPAAAIADEPAMVERRRAPRQTLVAKATIRPDSSVHMASLVQAGFVSNISMNGVGFHTRKPLEVGGTYRITLELGPLKWASRFRVVSCRHHEESETFDVGGQFIGNELSRLPMAA